MTDDDDDLFIHTRSSDPSTSREAEEALDIKHLERVAYNALKAHGGWLTYFQWSEISGIKYASCTPRGKALWLAGRVEREKRPGLNDKGQIVNLLHFRAK